MASDIEREALRVRDVYARRAADGLDSRYDYWQPANLFIYQTRERDFLRLLRDAGFLPLAGRRVLDVGCGDGGVLRDLIRYGASPADLTGVDLLAERVERARDLTLGARIEQGDAQSLPFEDRDGGSGSSSDSLSFGRERTGVRVDSAFDLVLGFTLLSSVLDDEARHRIAAEMQRVLAPGGIIVLYDFWTNPLNRAARPLRRGDVRALFPGAALSFYRTTLAPPLVRLLAPLPGGWLACSLLEVLPFVRTHNLVAIRPGTPLNEDFLPLAVPDISEDDIAEVVDTLRSGWLVYGQKTQRFEAEFRKLAGSEHAVAVSSCTAGLHLALLAAGVGPGDEVITTPLTFPATANVIVHTGATPVLADICADDLNIDPAAMEARITPRTKALLPVHYAGQACRMDEILDIGRRHGLRVIEDAATAAGATYKGRPVGSLGDATVFSFYAIKNMTTGEGGIVTTDDGALAEKVASLRNHGLDSSAWNRYAKEGRSFYTVTEPGFKYPFTDLQASLGLGQLARLPEFNARRTQLAERYTRLFASIPEIQTPTVRDDAICNWHIYVIRLRLERLHIGRDAFIDELKARGIGTAVHYYPVHYHTYYHERFGFQKGDYPVAEREFERLISLPMFPRMSDTDVDRVVGAVEEIVAANRA